MIHNNPTHEPAKFERALPSIVKSIRQRDLLNSWLRLDIGGIALPRLADYDTSRMADDLVDMMVLKVTHTGNATRFLLENTTLDTGKTPSKGEPLFLDDVLGPERYPVVLPYYQACLEHRRPIYSFAMVNDDENKEVSYERLLLPFGESETLTHIVGSFKTVSIEGGFKIKDLTKLKADKSVSITRAIIYH